MVNKENIYQNIISLLDSVHAEYKLFEHRAALTYEDLAAVQKEAGFIGTEGKCLVMKAGGYFLVYVTLQGQKVDFNKAKEALAGEKVRLATAEELQEQFGAEPGCAYPFGFENNIPIFVDPAVFTVDWFLFSPLYSTKTAQVRGKDMESVYKALQNKVSVLSL